MLLDSEPNFSPPFGHGMGSGVVMERRLVRPAEVGQIFENLSPEWGVERLDVGRATTAQELLEVHGPTMFPNTSFVDEAGSTNLFLGSARLT